MSENVIRFNAVYGDKILPVELAQANGGGSSYQIMINRYWYGRISYIRGVWTVIPQNKDYFTSDDIDALIEIMERERPKGY